MALIGPAPMQKPASSNQWIETPVVTTTTPSAGRKKNHLKPSTPADFDGDRAKGKAFLTSCHTYIRLCADSFEDNDTKIVWAMSFMKTGRASRWAQRELEHEAAKGSLRFTDWLDFEDEFCQDFTPLNAEATAVNILEGNSYFQGRQSVDDYLDQFQDLIYDSGYTDPKTIVVKFQRGLDRCIASAIGAMATGRPTDVDAEGWFELAVQLDQNRAADEAFQASYWPAPATALVPAHSNSRPGLISIPRHTAPQPATRFAHTNPTPGNPVPMDIDAACRGKPMPDTCR